MSYGLDILSREDYKDWILSIPQGTCPFCEYKKYQYILYSGKHWNWVVCRSPYFKYHTMIVPKRHIIEINELTAQEMGELLELYELAINKFRILKIKIDNKIVDRFMFFWRLRENLFEEETGSILLNHLIIHLVPDRAQLLDPILDSEATDWDPEILG